MTAKTIWARRVFARRTDWAYRTFWSWNLIFLAFVVLGFGPLVLPDMLAAARSGDIPPTFLIYALILTAIPLAATILGLTVLRRAPEGLFVLGYGIEGPLMLMVAVRFFVVRELMPGMALLLVMGGLGLATLLWRLLDRRPDVGRPALTLLRVLGLTLLLLVGLYAAIWIAFYVVALPVLAWRGLGELLNSFGRFLREAWTALSTLNWAAFGRLPWGTVPFAVLGSILAVFSILLLIVMPVGVPVLYVREWWQSVRALVAARGRAWGLALPAVVLAVCAGLFFYANRQPQRAAFALLADPPATQSQAQALLGQEEVIRAGLVNAYLAPWRYLSAVDDVRHVREIYKDTFNLPEQQALGVERLYQAFARPILYEPVRPVQPSARPEERPLQAEPAEAARLYWAFFDQPIVVAERASIVRAARSSWSLDQVERGWQAVDDIEVQLVRQEVNLVEHGDWVDAELYEVYRNQTGQRQEVVYYFSLPESAVITGVWLGNSPDRTQRFEYRVSPRGAAQAVYRNEVRRNMDPALVEQIGPRQYRLRVFPVEPISWQVNGEGKRVVTAAPELHMWLTWRAVSQDGAWPLPRLAEKRNVYWDETSLRLLNGLPIAGDGEDWLPASIPAAGPIERVPHRIDFPGGESVLIEPIEPGSLPELPGELRLAVVLDRSRSMAEYRDEVGATLARIAELGGDPDLYLTASQYRGEDPSRTSLSSFDATSLIFFGGQNAAELLAQFEDLRAGQSYDAVLVLTDGSGYELGEPDVDVPMLDLPVWMVHLSGDIPLGYDDGTLQAIQASGGGVAGDIDEALVRLAAALEAAGTPSIPVSYDVIDGYAWSVMPTEAASAQIASANPSHGGEFAPLAARRLILSVMQRQRAALDDVSTLDRLHAIAQDQGIVTPYSSMIVLVNENQRRLLDKLEQRGDRFEREYEAIGDTEAQNALAVTGVPEPEEWLLMGLAALMLAWYAWKSGALRLPVRS